MPVILDSVLKAGEGKLLRKLKRIADQVNSIEDDFLAMSDEELRGMTDELKQRHEDGETLDDLLPEAFATVREAAHRVLGQRHFDVQLMGGAAIHLGNIAEMRTGEGKTLTSLLPAYLNALTDQGVHVVTVNDYLAKRDAEWMGRVHQFLGLEVGVIMAEMPPEERRRQYAADITYGTNNEFGFDYLRDNMAWSQGGAASSAATSTRCVDEVDSILIDEAQDPADHLRSRPTRAHQAGTPTSPGSCSQAAPGRGRRRRLRGGREEEDGRRARVAAWSGSRTLLGIDNLYESVNTPLVGYLNNAIKAKELYKKRQATTSS